MRQPHEDAIRNGRNGCTQKDSGTESGHACKSLFKKEFNMWISASVPKVM
jgi:hypothetical protein